MARIDVADVKALNTAVRKYLDELPSDLVCALQLWYEGLAGQGVPNPAEMAAMEEALRNMDGWKEIGNVRYEKFGAQMSYKRVK